MLTLINLIPFWLVNWTSNDSLIPDSNCRLLNSTITTASIATRSSNFHNRLISFSKLHLPGDQRLGFNAGLIIINPFYINRQFQMPILQNSNRNAWNNIIVYHIRTYQKSQFIIPTNLNKPLFNPEREKAADNACNRLLSIFI